MKIVLIALGSLVAVVLLLVAVAALIGSRLPRRHEVSRSLVLAARPEDLFRAMTDFANAPAWRKEIRRVEMLAPDGGRTRFKEHGAHGAITYEVVAAEPPRTLVTEIVDRDLGYSGSWTYSLQPELAGTRVTITERGDVSNVLFRFLSRYVFGQTKSIETYLAALSEHVKRRG